MSETVTASLPIPERLRKMRKPLTARQAATEIGIHYVSYVKGCAEGKLPHTRIGSRIMVDPIQLAIWWEARTVQPR